ncbi:MAG: hypothetical protein FJW99_04185 [Actinobacteria bacterium]|nr:hypothetical protein [Actinomycetota bacterium]MBM3697765.1 hypothetical protein [Actinomycetota bacterium]
MGWDDEDDDWPERETDPEVIAKKRENARVAAVGANRAVRLVYATLAILLIIVIVLAIILT